MTGQQADSAPAPNGHAHVRYVLLWRVCQIALDGRFAESYAGGHTAPAMKAADTMPSSFTAKPPSPVFLEISDEEAKFHPAGDLWGKETNAAEDALLAKVGVEEAQAIVIGPAGENQVSFATIQNNTTAVPAGPAWGRSWAPRRSRGWSFTAKLPPSLPTRKILKLT